jgi:hypothetical protein
MFPSKPEYRNNRSRNGAPWKLTPWVYQENADSKDKGWALLDGGSSPPSFVEDGHVITDVAVLVIHRSKGTCKEPNSQVIHTPAR